MSNLAALADHYAQLDLQIADLTALRTAINEQLIESATFAPNK